MSLQDTQESGSKEISSEIFWTNTMQGLERGLTVGTIASSPLVTCSATDAIEDVLSYADWDDFDVLPVVDNRHVIAVIERGSRLRRPLNSGMLVTWDQPLEEFLATPNFIADGYRLVVHRASIVGIVTPSDLLRLPVRVLSFALLSHLEHTMNTVINSRCSDPAEWLTMLSLSRQEFIRERRDRLSERRMNPDPLESTDLKDKIKILTKLNVLTGEDRKLAWKLNALRNDIAHGKDYVGSQEDLTRFVTVMDSIRGLIARVELQKNIA